MMEDNKSKAPIGEEEAGCEVTDEDMKLASGGRTLLDEFYCPYCGENLGINQTRIKKHLTEKI